MAAALLADFPLRSYWSLPSGAPRFAPVSPTKVALLGYQWMCALLVFVTMSNQRAGLWGPSLEACAACNGTQQCTSGVGGPHGLGCPYTAFGQFQFLCAVGVMWWTGTAILLGLAYMGRSPPLMTEFLIYVAFFILTLLAWSAATAMCSAEEAVRGVAVCLGAGAAKSSCWFAFFTLLGLALSLFWSFREWKVTQFEGLPPKLAQGLGRLRPGGAPGAEKGGGRVAMTDQSATLLGGGGLGGGGSYQNAAAAPAAF